MLRPLESDDLDLVAALYGDPDVMRYSRVGVQRRDQVAARLEEWLRPGGDRYWVICPADRPDAGLAFLRGVDDVHRSAELGYLLGPSAWGRGIATASVARLLEIAFDDMALCRVEAYVTTGNGASVRVLEKNGFEHEGRRRADTFRNGIFEDSFLLSRLNEPLIRSLAAGAATSAR